MQTDMCTIFSLPLYCLDPKSLEKQKEQLAKVFKREVQYAMGSGVCTFNMALCEGSSVFLSRQLIKLRDTQFPHMKIHIYIPYETQANDWSEDIREPYFQVQAEADEVFILSNKLKKGVFHQQNQILMEQAGHLLLLHDNVQGSFLDKLSTYAVAKGMEVQVLYLKEGPPVPMHLLQKPILNPVYHQESRSHVRSMYSPGLSKGKSASNSAW